MNFVFYTLHIIPGGVWFQMMYYSRKGACPTTIDIFMSEHMDVFRKYNFFLRIASYTFLNSFVTFRICNIQAVRKVNLMLGIDMFDLHINKIIPFKENVQE